MSSDALDKAIRLRKGKGCVCHFVAGINIPVCAVKVL